MFMKMDMNILQQVDDATELRIAEEFPIDFGKDEMFEKIYQTYIDDAQMKSSEQNIIRKAQIYRIAVFAACLLLIVGFSVDIWSRQQKLPVRQPVAEPTIANESEACDTTSEIQETKHIDTVPIILPVSTEAMTEKETEIALQTESLENITVEIEPTQTPETSVESDSVEHPLEKQVSPVIEMQTESVFVEETEPEPVEEQFEGFRVLHFTNYLQIICTDVFPSPDGYLQPYAVEGNEIELLETDDISEAVRSYQVAKGDKTFTVKQQEYSEFVLQVDEGELIDISVNRAHGFFYLREEYCTLYWFRDGEGFCISGSSNDLTDILDIARGFTPTIE